MHLFDKKKRLMVAKMAPNPLFPLVMPLNDDFALKGERVSDSYLWHLRYGHLDNRGLQLLKQKEMVIGLFQISFIEKICEHLWENAQTTIFPKTSWRSKAPFFLVHAEICGPTRSPSLNNKRYSLLLVDDFTRGCLF